tara:strand:- start:329 stop:703 length:375 start_codon:yes stop_codon:yes gene_type:complete
MQNNFTNETFIQLATLVIFPIGILLSIISICFTLFLKSKKLKLIEDILEDGRRCYSFTFFFSMLGMLHYATIFLSKLQSRRYGLLEKRDQVPQEIKQLFIINFFIFMMSVFLMFGSALIVYLLR